MKITCISDTHGKHNQITKHINETDLIIHSGDVSGLGKEWEIREFLDWFSKLPSKYKIFIAGNHDWFFEDNKSIAKDLLSEYPNIIYLENSEVIINGIKFYGSPQQPRFFNWAFNEDRGEKISRYWELIPEDTDVLITHGPAYGYGDLVKNSHHNVEPNVGCKDLLEFIEKIQPIYHICGHIHSGNGVYKGESTTFINASVLGENYLYTYLPIVIEINDGEF